MDKDLTMETKKYKVCVTGSTGLVGSEAVKFFKEKGWDVVGIDYNMRHKFFGTPNKDAEIEIDIRSEAEVNLLFSTNKPFDAIVHTAAQPSHDYSKDHVREDFEINAVGTLNLLEAAKTFCPSAVFVHCSTDKIYGMGMTRRPLNEGPTRYDSLFPFTETTPIISPMSPFGVSKLYADFIVQEYAKQGWLKTVVFRMGCITGRAHEGAEMHGFLAYLAKCIKEGKVYKIFGFKGKQIRDQIHAYDLVNAFWHFIQNPTSGEVYNMGGGEERSVSVLEAGEMISTRTGLPFIYEMHEGRFGDRQWDVHDLTKFREDYPEWEYKYSLQDIVDDLCS